MEYTPRADWTWVTEPWVEFGYVCRQLRIPQGDGSNVEHIVRIALYEVADLSDPERDSMMALAAGAIAADYAPQEDTGARRGVDDSAAEGVGEGQAAGDAAERPDRPRRAGRAGRGAAESEAG